MRRKDGSLVWMEMNARAIPDPATGEASEVVVVMRDITEYKVMEERLTNLALSDGLTGLANRRAFDQALEREWELHASASARISRCCCSTSTTSNGSTIAYGHQAGDDCLRRLRPQ